MAGTTEDVTLQKGALAALVWELQHCLAQVELSVDAA